MNPNKPQKVINFKPFGETLERSFDLQRWSEEISCDDIIPSGTGPVLAQRWGWESAHFCPLHSFNMKQRVTLTIYALWKLNLFDSLRQTAASKPNGRPHNLQPLSSRPSQVFLAFEFFDCASFQPDCFYLLLGRLAFSLGCKLGADVVGCQHPPTPGWACPWQQLGAVGREPHLWCMDIKEKKKMHDVLCANSLQGLLQGSRATNLTQFICSLSLEEESLMILVWTI